MTSLLMVKYMSTLVGNNTVNKLMEYQLIQGGAEQNDTFQMVIDNIWKQGKMSETVYKYLQICYLLPTDYKLIF